MKIPIRPKNIKKPAHADGFYGLVCSQALTVTVAVQVMLSEEPGSV